MSAAPAHIAIMDAENILYSAKRERRHFDVERLNREHFPECSRIMIASDELELLALAQPWQVAGWHLITIPAKGRKPQINTTSNADTYLALMIGRCLEIEKQATHFSLLSGDVRIFQDVGLYISRFFPDLDFSLFALPHTIPRTWQVSDTAGLKQFVRLDEFFA